MAYVRDYTALITNTSTWNHISGRSFDAKPVFLTYSFADSPPPLSNGVKYQDPNYFRPLNDQERGLFRDAINAWSSVSGIHFFEAPSGLGDIEAGGYQLTGNLAGQGSMPSSGIYRQFEVIARGHVDLGIVRLRGGSVCLNSLRGCAKWISALVMPLPGLASAH